MCVYFLPIVRNSIGMVLQTYAQPQYVNLEIGNKKKCTSSQIHVNLAQHKGLVDHQ